MKKGISLLLSIALMLSLTSCVRSIEILSSTKRDVDLSPIEITEDSDKTAEITQFSLNTFNHIFDKNSNVLISPLSIATALAMVTNGAENETLSQIEDVLGSDIDTLNDFLHAYNAYLPSDDKYTMYTANSIWIKDDESLFVEDDFLFENKEYYNAEVFKTMFDQKAIDEINEWVYVNTDKQIEEMLKNVPTNDVVMYLINALSFDAEWQNIYEDVQVRKNGFTDITGETTEIDFLYSEEHSYIEMDNAVGFKKYYADRKYSFVALLPDENINIDEFMSSLNGEELIKATKSAQATPVNARIPKFTFEYDIHLNETLIDLGMTDAFDSAKADFYGIGTSNGNGLYISDVIHKTKIAVDEKGTKAGAVTVVAMAEGSSETMVVPKEVYLERPFFFMIVDEEFNLPLFMGVHQFATE